MIMYNKKVKGIWITYLAKLHKSEVRYLIGMLANL